MPEIERLATQERRLHELLHGFFRLIVTEAGIPLTDADFAELVVSALKPEQKAMLLERLDLPGQNTHLHPYVDRILLTAMAAGRLTPEDIKGFAFVYPGQALLTWLRHTLYPKTGTSGV
jgi:hypothetical protein